MREPHGWYPCQHWWEDVIRWGEGEWYEQCAWCGEERTKAMDESRKGGWREIRVDVERDDPLVALSIYNEGNPNKPVYRAKFTPEVARELAFRLTSRALEIEDE